MSEPLRTWYSLHDLQSLGTRRVELGGSLELGNMPRLKSLLDDDRGCVEAALQFHRDGAGWLLLDLELHASLKLSCQRCLEPMDYTVDERVELALLESPALEATLPKSYEPMVLEGDRLQPAQLIEDELIVSLPLVPKHARAAECGALGRSVDPAAESESR